MSKLHILPIFSGSLLIFSIAAGCTRPKAETDHSNLPEDVKPAATAIITDSASKFAAAINYPLERPYPLHNIKDSAEMVKYYPTLVDDSLKNKVKAAPDSLWSEIGWRGWTLDDGSYLWIDSGKVYQVNYISKRENQLLDSLRSEEIASLDPSLRNGWIPVLCIVDSINDKIFRIDSDETVTPPQYRLAAYASGTDLSGIPTMILYGTMDVEGTMANRLYHFEDSVGNQADYYPDLISEEDTVPEINFVEKGQPKTYKVKPGYWLEHIRKSVAENDAPVDSTLLNEQTEQPVADSIR